MPRSDPTPTVRTVTVKNYQPVPSLSEESEAFSATVYLDGKRAGRVTNHGNGGCNLYDFDSREQRDTFMAYARAWGADNDASVEPEDALIQQLCEDDECRKRGRRALAAGAVGLVVVYQKPVWFTDAPRTGKPAFYDELILVPVLKGEKPEDAAARYDAEVWRVVPTEGV